VTDTNTSLSGAFDSLQIGFQPQVDHTGHGVRTPRGGRTAGHHFRALDRAGRNDVEIESTVGERRNMAPTIDQDERPVRAERAQVRIDLTDRDARTKRRDLLKKIAHGQRRRTSKLFHVENRGRRRRVHAIATNSGARNDNFFCEGRRIC
jgi:hypothetical protein